MLEKTVQWGEDTRCIVCLEWLPAGAPYYRDDDGELCTHCAAAEDPSSLKCPDCDSWRCAIWCPSRFDGPLSVGTADGVYATSH